MSLLTLHSTLDTQQEYNHHFFLSVQHQYFSQAQRMLKMGANPHVLNQHRRTAFMELFFQSKPIQIEFVRNMIQTIPMDLNELDNKFQTILHGAALHGHINVIPLLIEEGADIDAMDLSLRTPLMYAAQREGNTQLLRVLLEHGADPNWIDSKGFTAVMYAVKHGDFSMVKTLVDYGADIHYVSTHQWSAMKLAQKYKKYTIMSFLSLKGAKCHI